MGRYIAQDPRSRGVSSPEISSDRDSIECPGTAKVRSAHGANSNVESKVTVQDDRLRKDLASRHEAESEFHDRKYGRGEGFPRHYAVHPTYPIYLRMLKMTGNLAGKQVLEYGCGDGGITRDLAQNGAMVSTFDISAEAVNKTHQMLASAGLADRCRIAQMGAERLDYPDESFDMAVGFAILHHLDLKLAITELYRVLRPGGVAYFAEPLGTNPLINLYRRLTPQYRTEDEEPLNLKALAPLLSRFRKVEHSDYYVTALAAIALAYLPFGSRFYPSVNRQLMKLDDGLLRWFPGLGWLAWYTILTLRK
ncbi:MAG: methyltransferase domain-containing protein [Betaproteobacteria bacterium]|nr:MAG: methyltransferase domain-containing protein [Betaproteobacteria bacterium]